MPWITTLDGRDSRALHGNFAPSGHLRPDMELDCRMRSPVRQKFISTAAPHHGQAYGSLAIIDPRVVDDDAMAPVRSGSRRTIGLPGEPRRIGQVYGTAWPLSEDYYLCVYDAKMRVGGGTQGGPYSPRQLRHLPG